MPLLAGLRDRAADARADLGRLGHAAQHEVAHQRVVEDRDRSARRSAPRPGSSSCCPRACTRRRWRTSALASASKPALASAAQTALDPRRRRRRAGSPTISRSPKPWRTRPGAGLEQRGGRRSRGRGRAAARPSSRAAGIDARERRLVRRRRPGRNHHGTPFIAGSTTVVGPSSGAIAAPTAGSAGALTAMTTRSCAPSAAASSLAVERRARTSRAALLDLQAVGADAGQRLAARERRDLVAGARPGGPRSGRRRRPGRRPRPSSAAAPGREYRSARSISSTERPARRAFRQNSTIVRFCPIARRLRIRGFSRLDTDDAAADGPAAGARAPADERPADPRRHRRRRARRWPSHIGLEGLSIGALAEVTQHEQVGRVRPLRLARGTADLGRSASTTRSFEEEVFYPAMQRAARPAAPARAVRPLDEARLGRDRFRLHLHQRRRRVRRPPGPGARRAGRRWCRPGRRRSSARSAPPSTRATCAPTPTPSSCCSRSTA